MQFEYYRVLFRIFLFHRKFSDKKIVIVQGKNFI